MKFGYRLAQLREAAKLSQEALALACGHAQGWVGNIEKGKNFPRIPDLYLLAKALNVHPGELLEDSPNIKAEQTELNTTKLAYIIEMLEMAIGEVGISLKSKTKAKIIAALYKDERAVLAADAMTSSLTAILTSMKEEA